MSYDQRIKSNSSILRSIMSFLSIQKFPSLTISKNFLYNTDYVTLWYKKSYTVKNQIIYNYENIIKCYFCPFKLGFMC